MLTAVGLVMGLHCGITVIFGDTKLSFDVILHYLPVSLFYISSMLIGYIGLRYLELSVLSPICNSSGAIVVVLCLIFLNRPVDAFEISAVILVCVGVILLGITEYREDDEARALRQKDSEIKYTKSLIAILIPIAYCLLDALGTFADGIILETMDEDSANAAYELTFFIMGAAAFIYAVIIKKEKLTVKRDAPKLLCGVFETAGQLAYVYAMADNMLFTAPVVSAYCAASVLWSRIFLKEKLSFKHYICIIITVIGIVMLGISDV